MIDEKRIKTLSLKSIEDLLHLLENDPSLELFAALHRLCLRYSSDPDQDDASSFFFRLSVFDESLLGPQYQTQLEILRSVSAHARIYDTYNYRATQKRLAEKFAKDSGMLQLLQFLSASGSTRAKELQEKLGTLPGFERIIKRCLDNKLIHVYESSVLPDLISITHKGRRVLTHLGK